MTMINTECSESLADMRHAAPSFAASKDRFYKWYEENRGAFGWTARPDVNGNVLVTAAYRGDKRPSLSINLISGCFNDFGGDHDHGTITRLSELLHVTPPECPAGALSSSCAALRDEEEQNDVRDPKKLEKVTALWNSAAPLTEEGHPYLDAKGLTGAAIAGLNLRVDSAGVLLVPVYSVVDEKMQGLQRIPPCKDSGGKWRKLSLGYIKGGCFGCGSKRGPLVLSEGIATAVSISMLSGEVNSCCCFGSKNIAKAAQLLRKRFPARKIYVASDNDEAGADALKEAEKLVSDVLNARPPKKINGRTLPDGFDWNDVSTFFARNTAAMELDTAIAVPEIMQQIRTEAQRKGRDECDFSDFTYSLKDTIDADFPPEIWPVESIIGPGLNLLMGEAKVGKTMFMAQVCAAVNSGADVFGLKTHKMPVLMVSLEDTLQSFNQRMRLLRERKGLYGETIDYIIAPVTLGPESTELRELVKWLYQHQPALAVVDTWGKAHPAGSFGRTAYLEDVVLMSTLKRAADLTHSSILLTHHLRKGAKDDTLLDKANGSKGLPGTVDNNLFLSRVRKDEEGTAGLTTLQVRLRGCPDDEPYYFTWDNPFFTRTEAPDMSAAPTPDKQGTIDRLFRLIDASPDEWTPKEAAAAVGCTDSTARVNLKRLTDEGRIISESRGKYHSKHIYSTTEEPEDAAETLYTGGVEYVQPEADGAITL